MSVGLFDKRPPFVRFEEREMGLNAEATEKEGRPIPRVVVMACITPHGSKDCHEAVAETWLAQLKQRGMSGDDYSQDCYEKFARQFNAWKEGNELPREGTPIKTWAMCTREAATRLIASGITTVEDLAAFPDSGLGAIGMDGRYLRDMARGWITEAKDKGANAKALADANVKIDRLETQNAELTERVNRLAARLEEEETTNTPRRGRGRKDEAA
jgi:hypothetical protein